jgi:hypothetical protein
MQMRWLWPLLALLISAPFAPALQAQDTAPRLNIVIVEGDGAINNIKQRTAREPIVQVEDENHRPVAGAAVVFALADQGAGGTFAGGSHTLSVVTDSQGRAVAHGFHPNSVQGQYNIRVTASHNGLTANASITQSNVVVAAGAATTAVAAGVSAKVIAIIVIAAAAAAGGGAYYATHSGGGGTTTTTATGANSPISITPGTGTVGPPR